MDLILVGINHRTAPIEVRERVALSEADVRDVLSKIRAESRLVEGLVLSTCNRTEFYGLSTDNGAAELYLRRMLDPGNRIDLDRHPGYAYTLTEEETVRHLFRVAAGLDSLVLGEAQILGQVKQAYQIAVETGTSGIHLHRLLQAATTVGKRVRAETLIGAGAVSVAGAAVELAAKIFEDLSSRSALLIGVGEMGTLTARHMMERGVSTLTIANRTFSRAADLAGELGGEALPLERLDEAMVTADIVISSTGSTESIVSLERMRAIMGKRSGRPIYIIDIAVPRDFDASIGRLDGVFLHNVDAMNALVKKNLEKRRVEIPKAETIVEKELACFMAWRRSLVAAPAIKKLREKLEEIRCLEVSRHRHRFCERDAEQADRLTESLLNKVLHPLMTHIREWSGDDELGATRIDTIYEVFELPRPEDPSE